MKTTSKQTRWAKAVLGLKIMIYTRVLSPTLGGDPSRTFNHTVRKLVRELPEEITREERRAIE